MNSGAAYDLSRFEAKRSVQQKKPQLKAVKGKKSVKEMAKELGVSACRCRIAIFTVKVGKLLTRS